VTDPFEHFDGAYVLGALSPAERELFEEHLEGCPDCAARVAEIADVPDYLAVVPWADAAAIDADAGPVPDTLLPRLLAAAAARRRRTRLTLTALGAVAAAAVVALVVLLWPGSPGDGTGSEARAMHAALPGVPVSATVRLVPKEWGTELDVRCTYADEPNNPGAASVPYQLVVYGRSGAPQSLSRWKIGPGSTARFVSATELDRADVRRIAIQLLPSHQTVLTLDV
jgi:Putative zinc-finger